VAKLELGNPRCNLRGDMRHSGSKYYVSGTTYPRINGASWQEKMSEVRGEPFGYSGEDKFGELGGNRGEFRASREM